jgi:hypothetical protein
MADFTLVPTRVIPLPPEYNNMITQAEGQKKQFQALATVPVERFKLVFERMSDANYLTLITHWNSMYGGALSFSWTSVPTYIDTNRDGTADGTAMTGRWVDGSLSEPVVNAYDVGDISIIFEKAI